MVDQSFHFLLENTSKGAFFFLSIDAVIYCIDLGIQITYQHVMEKNLSTQIFLSIKFEVN